MFWDTDELHRVLDEARDAGFLGPGPVDVHLKHAAGFAQVAEAALGHAPERLADLGTGGGVPGLVLASRWPNSQCSLVESNRRRCEALRWAVVRLGFGQRVEVIEERAEVVGQSPAHRERYELVSARSFAPPAPTAEIAAGLVALGGIVVVSDVPNPKPDRWAETNVAQLGFEPAMSRTGAESNFVILRKTAPTADEFPRRVGRPTKRPLW
jgi:16S rRNA (guanine527-N7)-methyltransferase